MAKKILPDDQSPEQKRLVAREEKVLGIIDKIIFDPIKSAESFAPMKEELKAHLLIDPEGLLNRGFQNGTNIYHLAALVGHTPMVQFVLEYMVQFVSEKDGVTLNSINYGMVNGVTALHCAAQAGHFEIVKLLLANGANVNQLDATKNTALHYATNHPKIVKLLVKKLLANGATAISIAEMCNQPEVVKCLQEVLEERAAAVARMGKEKAEQQQREKDEAVQATVRLKQEKDEEIAKINAAGEAMEEAKRKLEVSTKKNALELLTKAIPALNIVDVEKAITALKGFLAIEATKVAAAGAADANMLLTDILNKPDGEGNSYLHNLCQLQGASKSKAFDMVKMLITNGANPDCQNEQEAGYTPTMIACKENSGAIAKFLVERTKDFRLVDKENNSLLHHICNMKGKDVDQKILAVDMVKMLITNGVNPDCQNKDGYTSSMIACKEDSGAIAKFLIERTKDFRLVDKENNSLLHHICNMGNKDIDQKILAVLLLTCSGDTLLSIIDGKNSHGKIASEQASEKGKHRLDNYVEKLRAPEVQAQQEAALLERETVARGRENSLLAQDAAEEQKVENAAQQTKKTADKVQKKAVKAAEVAQNREAAAEAEKLPKDVVKKKILAEKHEVSINKPQIILPILDALDVAIDVAMKAKQAEDVAMKKQAEAEQKTLKEKEAIAADANQLLLGLKMSVEAIPLEDECQPGGNLAPEGEE